MAKKRKAQQVQNVDKSRPTGFYDAVAESAKKKKESPVATTVATTTTTTTGPSDDSNTVDDATSTNSNVDAARAERARQAAERYEQRPTVSTMIYDDETGMEIVAQGKSVMDVVTRKAVQLSPLGPDYRLAQMFPGVPPPVRQTYRFNWQTVDVPTMVESLRVACSVQGEIPPHPSIANKAIDFVLANRDYLSRKMKLTLGRLTMKAMASGDKQQARTYQKLWKNFLTLENHISAPFRQMIQDAEGRVGPNFGNLDLMSYCKGDLYERCANYLVLKGMVAHWEKKVVDADYVEKTPQTNDNYMRVLSRGDPRRYLPDPPILFSLRECTQVCYMAQQMTKTFVETPELFNDLPPELRFIEYALTIKGGTALRKFVIEDFCPAEGITPEGLREGVRRVYAQLENMQVDPYADICNVLEKLVLAMSVGTDDERDPYTPYLANRDLNGPGSFPTYTFDHDQLSLVRFLDGQYERAGNVASSGPRSSSLGGLAGLFNLGSKSPTPDRAPTSASSGATYKVPEARAAGRAHELGWLDILSDDKDEGYDTRFGKMKAGNIIIE